MNTETIENQIDDIINECTNYRFASELQYATNDERKENLRAILKITDSYLYKDLFAYEHIKKTSLFQKLLSALALQIGNEVSYNELASLVGANKETVEKYIALLGNLYFLFSLHLNS